MYLRAIKNDGAAKHVAIIADAMVNGEILSYQHGKPVKLEYYAQALLDQIAYALFFDPIDGTYKAIQSDPVTGCMRCSGYLTDGDLLFLTEKQGLFLVPQNRNSTRIRPLDAA